MIDPAQRFAEPLIGRAQVTFFFQTVQNRIERPGTKFVAVPCQLFDKPGAEDASFRGMMKKLKSYQISEDILIRIRWIHEEVAAILLDIFCLTYCKIAQAGSWFTHCSSQFQTLLIASPPTAVKTTTNHGGHFQNMSRPKATKPRPKSAGE